MHSLIMCMEIDHKHNSKFCMKIIVDVIITNVMMVLKASKSYRENLTSLEIMKKN
jgi:hypothetical protein